MSVLPNDTVPPCGQSLFGPGRSSAECELGTSLGALMLPIGAFIGAMAYHKNGHLDVRASILIAVGMIVGAYLGSQLVQHVSDIHLRRGFAVFLAIVSVRMWFS